MGIYDLSFYDVIQRNAIIFNNRTCWHEVDDGRRLTFVQHRFSRSV
jgi:hypothetical protein